MFFPPKHDIYFDDLQKLFGIIQKSQLLDYQIIKVYIEPNLLDDSQSNNLFQSLVQSIKSSLDKYPAHVLEITFLNEFNNLNQNNFTQILVFVIKYMLVKERYLEMTAFWKNPNYTQVVDLIKNLTKNLHAKLRP